LKRNPPGWFEEKWCCGREFGLELYIRCKEELLVMGVIVPLFLILEFNKKELIQSLEKRLCCGIIDWGISERRVFDYYMVRYV
jgi:hypothetical protein